MKTNVPRENCPDFIAEIDKRETTCTVDDVVAYLRERMPGDQKLSFVTVCSPSDMSPAASRGQTGAGLLPVFCFGLAFADARLPVEQRRAVGVADMGDRFIVGLAETASMPAQRTMGTWLQRLMA
ncbi:MAG: hypothetical protein HY778_17915 [Betaproteobacteria bacterium]|nr:hypothetical protein [Betaproteobacteria bacterium]